MMYLDDLLLIVRMEEENNKNKKKGLWKKIGAFLGIGAAAMGINFANPAYSDAKAVTKVYASIERSGGVPDIIKKADKRIFDAYCTSLSDRGEAIRILDNMDKKSQGTAVALYVRAHVEDNFYRKLDRLFGKKVNPNGYESMFASAIDMYVNYFEFRNHKISLTEMDATLIFTIVDLSGYKINNLQRTWKTFNSNNSIKKKCFRWMLKNLTPQNINLLDLQ